MILHLFKILNSVIFRDDCLHILAGYYYETEKSTFVINFTFIDNLANQI